jgi:hypothetical protein
MSGALGIWQHARGSVPDETHGMCTDDVARALTVDLLQANTLGWGAVRESAARSLTFISAAWNPASGFFRNVRSADGSWLDEAGSQDTQGRALLAIGTATRDLPDVEMRIEAQALFEAALPVAGRLTSPRAIASAILGCDGALGSGMRGGAERYFVLLVRRLRGAFSVVQLEGDWPWPEHTLTYENALLPHALIAGGRRLSDGHIRSVGLTVLDWLIETQTSRSGTFSPVGNDGWWTHEGPRSQFDQQPIEATAMILAASAAYEATRDAGYVRAAEAAYGWFLGANDAGLMMADIVTGACHDGLSADRVNVNQGAESTLMWLTAVETMRGLRTKTMAARSTRVFGRATTLVEVRS